MNLAASRVWLTGASSGIGEALVASLVARGARVAITARRAGRLDEIARRFGDGLVLPLAADVTDRRAISDAAARAEISLGGIDMAIFNAGGHVADRRHSGVGTGDSPPLDADSYAATMTLNYLGVVYGIESVLPGMLARGSGRIVAVASLAGYRATPIAAAYGSSKAAVIHLMDSLRFDLEPRGVGVTVVNPGFVRTPLTANNRVPMPFLLEADDAAERIVRGLERDRKEIHFPAALSWPMKAMRVVPWPIYQWLVRRALRQRAGS